MAQQFRYKSASATYLYCDLDTRISLIQTTKTISPVVPGTTMNNKNHEDRIISPDKAVCRQKLEKEYMCWFAGGGARWC